MITSLSPCLCITREGLDGFCVSVGVLRHSTPVAGCVMEFTGGPNAWVPRVFAAHRNGGSTCNGKPISISSTRKLQDALVVSQPGHRASRTDDLAIHDDVILDIMMSLVPVLVL